MTENEPYTPTTQQVRDAVLMSGKPFDQIVEIDDPVEGYSIYDQYVEPGAAFARWLTQHDAEVLTAARPRLVAESREALVHYFHEEGALEQAPERLTDSMIADGVVTLATPAETASPTEDELFDAIRSTWTESKPGNSRYNLAWDAAKAVLALLASRSASVASQGDTPEGEEWEDPEPWQHGLRVRHGNAERDRYCLLGGCVRNPRTREQYEADQKPVVPVDSLGFPTEVGGTFRARDAKAVTEFTVVEPGLFERRDGGFYEPQELDPSSIEDVRAADGRNGR